MIPDPLALFASFDGRDTAPLREIAGASGDIDAMIAAVTHEEPRVQVGATWVLKSWIEGGTTLGPLRTERVIALLAAPIADDARLHLLQILPYLDPPASKAPEIFEHAIRGIDSHHVFVRAWAYNALAVAASLDPALHDEVEALFEDADGEPASVRARIRNARKGRLRPARRRG